MKELEVLGVKYNAEKIIKQNNNIKLINVIDENGINIGNLEFPNISNIDNYKLEEGKKWDIDKEQEFQQRINDLELYILMQEGLI